MEAFERLKSTSVLVYINAIEIMERQQLSPVVMGGLNAISMGRTLPRVVLSSPDQLRLYSTMSYQQTKSDKEFRRVDKEVRGALKGGSQPGLKDAVDCWMLKGVSSFYRGNFVSLNDDQLLIRGPNGKEAKLPLAQLSPAALAYARAMAAGEAAVDAAGKEVKNPPMEAWQSRKGGKVFHAKFISLKADKITIEMTEGKRVTFNLALLSEKSQQRAKELGLSN